MAGKWFSIEYLNKNRQFLMGVAMLLVVFYHSPGLLGKIFIRGLWGVDIFLMLGALGLCYSWQKNKVGTFYKRRLLRIMPLYILFAITKSLSNIYIGGGGDTLSIWDWFCDLTTLSYWNLGGNFIDWYICAYIFLALLFPALYYGVKRFGMYALIASVIVSVAIYLGMNFSGVKMDWYHSCLVGRLPIFTFGVYLFFNQDKERLYKILPYILLALITVIVVFCKVLHPMQESLTNSFWGVLLVIAIWYIQKLASKKNVSLPKIRRCLKFTGKHSLEIYLGNCMAMTLAVALEMYSRNSDVFLFWIETIVFSCIFIWLNKFFCKVLG